jgi:phage terminase small subunit
MTMARANNRIGPDGLTPREREFVSAYALTILQDGKGNGKQACISMGVPEAGAANRAVVYLKSDRVKSAIAVLMDQRCKRYDVTSEKIVAELAKMGFSNMRDYLVFGKDGSASIDWSTMTEEQAAAIQEVTIKTYPERTGQDDDGKPTFEQVKEIKFKLHDKKGSLELLGKTQKLFTDGLVLQNPDGSPVNTSPTFIIQFEKP